MAATTAKLQKAISEILDEANLDEITTKKVREQVEKKLGVSLAEKRKQVDQLIMDALNEKRAASDDEEEEEEESEEEEKKPAKRGRKAPAARNGSDSGSEDEFEPAAKKGRKPAAKKGKAASPKKAAGGGRKPGTGYTKECKLSPELAAVMGQPAMARHEVVKQVWKLIKEKNLYDPKNKQFAICNDELLSVFGVKRFRTFGMMKYLKNHFLAD